MAHVPLFWLIVVGLVLAVGLVGGGLARLREQRRHLRAMLRIGVDAVYCDNPERMVTTVESWESGVDQ